MLMRSVKFERFAISLLLLAILITSCTPASSPLDVQIAVKGEPIVNATVDLSVTISTQEQADNLDFSLSLSPGLELITGSPSWQGSLQKDESIVLSFSIKVLREGDWPLAVYAFNSYTPGSETGFGDGETIYLISRQASGEVISKADYEGTPDSPVINQGQETLLPMPTE
jgi:hypothetical protein